MVGANFLALVIILLLIDKQVSSFFMKISCITYQMSSRHIVLVIDRTKTITASIFVSIIDCITPEKRIMIARITIFQHDVACCDKQKKSREPACPTRGPISQHDTDVLEEFKHFTLASRNCRKRTLYDAVLKR